MNGPSTARIALPISPSLGSRWVRRATGRCSSRGTWWCSSRGAWWSAWWGTWWSAWWSARGRFRVLFVTWNFVCCGGSWAIVSPLMLKHVLWFELAIFLEVCAVNGILDLHGTERMSELRNTKSPKCIWTLILWDLGWNVQTQRLDK